MKIHQIMNATRPGLLLLALVTAPVAWSQQRVEDMQPTPSATTTSDPLPAEAAAPAEKMGVVPKIDAGDLVKISVFGAPESDQEVRVGSAGDVSLNFIGAVHIAGLSPEQAQTTIAKKLTDGGFFTHPQVSVFVKEYATQGVSVLGEVQKPGVYPMLGSRRLFDVISLAGGATQRAGKVITITHRDRPQKADLVTLSNDPSKAVSSNVEIFPGDTIVVSKAGVVYVTGDVHRPSGVIMENGTEMTVLQAIAVAEGTNSTASLNNAKIIRRTPDGPQEIPLELKKILDSKAPDVRLQAEDIIFVPSSTAKSAGRRTLDAVIQAATGVAIYRR